MFPEDINTDSIEKTMRSETSPIGRSLCFDYKSKRFEVKDGKVSEIVDREAIKQWVELLIRTPADRFKVYGDSGFGLYLDRYIGFKRNNLGFVKSEMQREIEEKIVMNRAIAGIEDFDVSDEKKKLHIQFKILLNSGESVEGDYLV